ncbi:MAG: TIR domain-containing protein [Steroidobacteraceae bacterium]
MTEPSKAVFLSYASQDAAVARRIGDALRSAGLEVWFDQSELRGGDAWDEKIRRQIAECALFLPVISRTTAARLEGYFRLEWSLADQRTQRMARTRPFIVPLCVDDTHESSADVPESFLRVQWSRLPDGETTPAFVEHVRTLLPGAPASLPPATGQPRSNLPGAATRPTAPRPGSRTPLYVALGAVLVATGAVYVVLRPSRTPTPASPTAPAGVSAVNSSPATAGAIPEKSIAVLPFLDISEKKDQEYFSDGLAEELLDLLAQVPDLKVAARTSSFYFKGRTEDIAAIGAKLRVSHVLEGSVRRVGAKVRVTAQLIRTDNGYHVWSQTYDRDVKDIFKVQDEISASVVTALKAQLLGSTASLAERRSDNPEAYDQYLLGLHEYRLGDTHALVDARVAFERSIAADRSYGPPYAALAMVDFLIAADTAEDIDTQSVQRAFELADRAIALTPDLADAYSTRGFLRMNFGFDWPGARVDIDHALQLSPNDGDAQRRAGFLAQSLGQPLKAVAAQRRAVALDPLNANSVDGLAAALSTAGDYQQARQTWARLREISPHYVDLESNIGLTYLYERLPGPAKEACEQNADVRSQACLAAAEYLQDHKTQAAVLFAELAGKHAKSAAYPLARAYALIGDSDHAFEWLDRALDARRRELSNLKTDPGFAALRSDPRFGAMLDKLHLPH